MNSNQTEGDDSLDQTVQDFLVLRPRLFGIAYRILGSAADAEDILQEVWLRWQGTDRSVVNDPPAFLATMTVRLSINVAQSARFRRESYVGPWLPEPVDTRNDLFGGAERDEALDLAVLLLMEKLTPAERAAFVLREAFAYPYAQIAEILQVAEAYSRQLVSRARKHIATGRKTRVDATEHRRLLESFLIAAQEGNLVALENLFSADVVSYSDGGGIKGAAAKPVSGRMQVARFISGFAARFWPGTHLDWVEANGQLSVLISKGQDAIALLSVDVSESGVEQIQWMMNPDKLTGFSPELSHI